jgi:hypothetical protein
MKSYSESTDPDTNFENCNRDYQRRNISEEIGAW